MNEPENYDLSALLRDKDRILMAAWTLPNEGPLSEAQRKQALTNFEQYRRRADIPLCEVARQVDRPRESTIRELLKGVYRENADDHIRTLNGWVEQHARQQIVKLRGAYVSTKVAEDIVRVCRLVRENQTIGLCTGPAGIGKTRCAQALHETYVGSILLTIRTGCTHPKGLTSLLAEKLGVRSAAAICSEHVHLSQLERVMTRLEQSGRLIIIDEAHKLSGEGLELVREIHDATGCPVFMLATNDLKLRIERDADPDRGQLYSRFDVVWPLTVGRDVNSGGRGLFTVEEIRKLYEQPPIRLSSDAARYLQDVANDLGKGSLRRCRILLVNATRRARKRTGLDDDATVTVTADDLAYVDERLRPDTGDMELVKQRRSRAVMVKTA